MQRRFRPADRAVFRELDGEAIILHLDTGLYFGLDVVGTCIWRGLERQESVAAVVGALVAEFEVEEVQAGRDVVRLIDELAGRGLLVPEPAGADEQ